MNATKAQIIDTACELLESQGFQATGLNQIVKESGAPKGSLYYYFPEGKDELAEAAIERAGRLVAERIAVELSSHEDAAEAISRFVANIAHFVEASGFRSGGPLMTVAMETATTNERLNQACRTAYTRLQAAFEAKLAGRYARSQELASFITATIEGGIMLSRVHHTGDPLRQVAEQLRWVLQAAREESTV
jgi:TetR/AcrR family transcriptional regulator, lmrAB and yxaGH operons repressor